MVKVNSMERENYETKADMRLSAGLVSEFFATVWRLMLTLYRSYCDPAPIQRRRACPRDYGTLLSSSTQAKVYW